MAILRRLGAPLQTRAALACQEAGLAGGSPLVRIDRQKGARYVMADPGCVGGCLRLSETASGRQKNEDRPTLTNRVLADHVFASSSRTDEEAKPRPDLRASPGFPSSVGQTRAPCFFFLPPISLDSSMQASGISLSVLWRNKTCFDLEGSCLLWSDTRAKAAALSEIRARPRWCRRIVADLLPARSDKNRSVCVCDIIIAANLWISIGGRLCVHRG